jgi:hypothetical protein
MKASGTVIPLLSLFFAALLTPSVTLADKDIPDDFCVTQKEFKLFKMINDYRKAYNLPQLCLSRSLSYVAHLHAADLIKYDADSGSCNQHSWSNRGDWKACCYGKTPYNKACMTDKPSEITKYTGKGYEIIYWENNETTPEAAFNEWKSASASKAMLLNLDPWNKTKWVSLGISIEKEYAVAWFGEEADPEANTLICETREIIPHKPATVEKDKTTTPVVKPDDIKESDVIKEKTGRFYIVYGSFASFAEAKKAYVQVVKKDFGKAKILLRENKYTVSLDDFPDGEEARTFKSKLGAEYKQCWVLEN